MSDKKEWDVSEGEWHKLAIYPQRYEQRAMCNLNATSVERDDKLNALLDEDFGCGMFIPSPKTFKDVS